MPECRRCLGKGTVPSGAQCSVCLGLGSFETNPKYKRPDGPPDGFTAVHSNIPIEDVIALLPEGEPTTHE